MFEITSYGPTASRDLATLLLGDNSVVRKLYVLNAKMIMMHNFVCEMFDT